MLPWPFPNFMSSSWYISCQRWNTWWREFFSLPISTSTQTIVWYVATFPRQDFAMHTNTDYKDNQTFFLQYRLPWDSPLTWVIAAFAIDFCYYWVHRSAHGKSLLLVVLLMIVYWFYYLCITCYLFWVRRSAHGKCLVLVFLSFSYSFVLYNFPQSWNINWSCILQKSMFSGPRTRSQYCLQWGWI